ncbi:MAG: T9SS type A sorting domain-containing protein [Calditrichota bacterium]
MSPENKAYLPTYGQGVLVYNLDTQEFEAGEQNPLSGGPGVAFDASNNAYITDFGDGIGAGQLLVYSSSHQLLHNYQVSIGPNFVAVSDPAFTDIIENSQAVPDQIELYQNYPNPFNPGTSIDIELDSPGKITLEIYNLLGQKITTLYNGYLFPGIHHYYWDGLNSGGLPVSSGIYIYRLETKNSVQSHKMNLVR